MNEGIPVPAFEKEKPREAFEGDVARLMNAIGFTVDPEDEEDFKEQIRNEERFITVVGNRTENGKTVERFLKIPVSDNLEVDEPFRCQVLVGRFLKERTQIKTRGVVKANTDRAAGMLYAIMETFGKDEAEIGFIAGPEDMKLLTEREAKSCIETMFQLQGIRVEGMPKDVRESLADCGAMYDDVAENILETMDEEVTALDSPRESSEPYHQVLNRRFGTKSFKENVQELLEYARSIIEQEDDGEPTLLHGDLSPDNLYVYNNGEVEFLDHEWTGFSRNRAVATLYDYGNLRARAWNNPVFQNALDDELLSAYRERGEEKLGKAVVSLGILRSHAGLSKFFENYEPRKQKRAKEKERREATERDIPKAWKVMGVEFRR